MSRLDHDIHNCRALVVDGNPTSRSVLTAQLRDFGVGTVVQTGRVKDARNILENRHFDVVLCDYHFEGSEMSGQDLLDELRREQLLPFSTVFLMVTGEASYAKVTEAAESALDGYLLKPHNATSLGDRVLEARKRKRVLRHIFEAIERGDFGAAAQLCQARFEKRAPYWLYAARIGAELYLRLEKHVEAQQLYAAVVEARALPWAKLGIARSQLASGQVVPARRTLDALIGEMPQFADSYDVLGRVLVEQGEMQQAFEIYQKAAELTPGSVTRLLHAGTLAFFAGQSDQAMSALDRACVIGVASKMFDDHALVLLALLQFDAKDPKALQRTYDHLSRRMEKQPESRRLVRFQGVIDTLRTMQAKKVAEAMRMVRELTSEIDSPDMDMEAASNLIALWARLNSSEIQLDEMPSQVQRIAQRFCVSRASMEMLIASAQGTEPTATIVRETHASISATAEKAMGAAMNGAPADAVRLLLASGAETRNAKLIELAGLVAQRHHEKIADVESLQARARELSQRYCSQGAHLIGGSKQGGRSAGGLSLRAAPAAPAPATAQPAA
ncbi:response regulator [Piscinibacter terrae]|uniref:Response regulator n=1 Tax=Piscinibacter terrae TaxID=2496871 RepID=A0A3N7ITE5_9BURK|nr:response regulator [Albitalea terrae]RQP22112.1 response regulator [Albitalea terrae]